MCPEGMELAVNNITCIDSARTVLSPGAEFPHEAPIISKFSHQNIVSCVELNLWAAPHLILLELMSGADVKTFLRASLWPCRTCSSWPRTAPGSHYLEKNHFIHRCSLLPGGHLHIQDKLLVIPCPPPPLPWATSCEERGFA
ncbi:PREDICTED: leukocyte tyrosine kinase receptor [Miniopterus natalensis]|uniref:leukocyte tyrosine kinase receptor n=1 Tax=Miniopterus natalensis TaxID=291302 RepID=UPI0007A709A0|nr:PREDICTED: leukocyte tyrosine kinase receptor [Miniopterus natalensis]